MASDHRSLRIRSQPNANGYFKNAKPKTKSDLIEYDFDKSATLKVPGDSVVRRRFEAGLRNFKEIYMNLVDNWEWYDNSGSAPRLISEEGHWK